MAAGTPCRRWPRTGSWICWARWGSCRSLCLLVEEHPWSTPLLPMPITPIILDDFLQCNGAFLLFLLYGTMFSEKLTKNDFSKLGSILRWAILSSAFFYVHFFYVQSFCSTSGHVVRSVILYRFSQFLRSFIQVSVILRSIIPPFDILHSVHSTPAILCSVDESTLLLCGYSQWAPYLRGKWPCTTIWGHTVCIHYSRSSHHNRQSRCRP